MTDPESFESCQHWMKEIDKNAKTDVKRLLVGNKSDLAQKKAVDYNTAKEFADGLNMNFLETSSKNGSNVEAAFMAMAGEIRAERDSGCRFEKGKGVTITQTERPEQAGGCC